MTEGGEDGVKNRVLATTPEATSYTREQRLAVLYTLAQVEGGCVILEREPQSEHGWIEVFPTQPGPAFAIWKFTGAVHEVLADTSVSDEPIWRPE